jgi:hypothetical protein
MLRACGCCAGTGDRAWIGRIGTGDRKLHGRAREQAPGRTCRPSSVRGYAAYCQCHGSSGITHRAVLRRRTHADARAGHPLQLSSARTTSGLARAPRQEPVGWCAVEPRTATRTCRPPVSPKARGEEVGDAGVWAVTLRDPGELPASRGHARWSVRPSSTPDRAVPGRSRATDDPEPGQG